MVEHTPDDTSSISIAIIRSIAAIENVDPTELEITLYDYVNPEALDQLIEHEGTGSTEITFTVRGYYVHVHDTGEITVHEPN
ncbi:HalOD1 output domain-containing protein [Natronorubrum sp. FCH18a]|uniref:HalOD1 output domain-containing protein n=1 Tax=Natronorubrum sp. FCH18a TaxID=3447018 RepID=UPI003F51120F